MQVSTKFAEDKKLITFKNLFQESMKFNARAFYPITVPVHYCILYMLQSTDYALSPDFVSTFKKVDHEEAEYYWGVLHDPIKATIADVMAIVFSAKTKGKIVS